MFGLSLASQLLQGSTERTWNCVSNLFGSIWNKFNHLYHTNMPRSRKRHHSRSRSRSRSRSQDRREEKHRKIDSHEKDRDGKRRKIESFDSPHHKRSVSAEPTEDEVILQPVDATNLDQTTSNSDSENVGKSDKSVPVIEIDDTPNTSLTASLSKTLEITPNKVMSPRQLQKRLESEKKKQLRREEREEREKKKNEEKEQKKQELLKQKLERDQLKQKLNEEKQKQLEQKQKEKEFKEELRRKEKESKEELKRKEKEEKEQKRKEKEERDKEKEQEKLKVEEKKQKAAAHFTKFFVAIKHGESKKEELIHQLLSTNFMPFEVKSDMRLPPNRRPMLTDDEKANILQNNESASYLRDLKNGKILGKSSKTWPYEDITDDVIFEGDGNKMGHTILEMEVEKVKAKFYKFHENRRPAYFGTWRKRSKLIKPRKPFVEDRENFDYEVNSDDDWEEEENGESLTGSDDEDKEFEQEEDYLVDNKFFVPHGHLSDDEVDDEETARVPPEDLKEKLKFLKDEFEQDMKSKTIKIKPRLIGCIWYNKGGDNVDVHDARHLKPLAIIRRGRISVKNRDKFLSLTASKKKSQIQDITPEHLTIFLKMLHRNPNRKQTIFEEFSLFLANNETNIEISKACLGRYIKQMAVWRKCTEEGPMRNKYCWLLNDDVKEKYKI